MAQQLGIAREGGVVVLTMDGRGRPACIDIGMCELLLGGVAQVSPDRGDRVVLLRAAGPGFSAGGDLFAIAKTLDDPGALLAPLITRFHEVILALRALPLPVLAQVHGAVAGAGFSLAMACDLVIAGTTARLVAGYPRIGTSSDGGLTCQLARRLGAPQAMSLFLLEDAIPAERAMALGLVQRVVPDDALADEAMALASQLAHQPAQAVREIKKLISAAADEGLAAHLAREKEAFLRCAVTDDFRQRVTRFIERAARKPA